MSQTQIENVVLIGMPGTGKDVSAQRLVKLLWDEKIFFDYISVGTDVFRSLAASLDITIEEFNRRCIDDPQYDLKADNESLRQLEEDKSLIMTARTIPALLHLSLPGMYRISNPDTILKIRFDCDMNERIVRIAKREFEKKHEGREPSTDQLAEILPRTKLKTIERQELEAHRYKNLYNISDIYDDTFFDEIIDTTGMSVDEQVKETYTAFMNHWED